MLYACFAIARSLRCIDMLSGSDNVMAYLNDMIKKMGGGNVEVGFSNGATYPDGALVAGVAYENEFGVPSRNQPPRPFFRNMIAKESPTWGATMAKLMKSQKYNGNQVLGLMGEDIAGALVQSIIDFKDPGNAPRTIAEKGFDDPLVDTGDMKSRDSITAVINE